jgi:protein ImuA
MNNQYLTMAYAAVADRSDDPDTELPVQPRRMRPQVLPGAIPEGVWRGSELGSQVEETVATGWEALDAQLPGGGWPRRSLTEVLAPQPTVLEWRLLSGALARVAAEGGELVLVGPPKHPHVPGLLRLGLDRRRLVWIQASTPAERLWVTEQMIKSDSAGAVVAWLPQARAEQIRRLQVCALGCRAPVFLCRPEAARHESSAAPLRVHARQGLDWELQLELFKRRGPSLDAPLRLPSIPGGLAAVLTPRLMKPSLLTQRMESVDAVGSPASRSRSVRQLALH